MNWNLNEFINETEYCDCHHPEITTLSTYLTKNIPNNRDKAIALFIWVRDNILYRVGMWNKKASQTLYEREGTCTNKSNLLVALLRAINIPAGYGLLKVDGHNYWGPATPSILGKHVGKISNHIYSTVFLDDWFVVDPSDDAGLCQNIGYINPTATLLNWDGKSDARIPLDQEHIYSDEYPLVNIDHIISKKPKNITGIKLSICNVFIKFLRETKQRFNSPEEVEESFLYFLKLHHSIYYKSLMIASRYKDLKDLLQKHGRIILMWKNQSHKKKISTNRYDHKQNFSEQLNEE